MIDVYVILIAAAAILGGIFLYANSTDNDSGTSPVDDALDHLENFIDDEDPVFYRDGKWHYECYTGEPSAPYETYYAARMAHKQYIEGFKEEFEQ